MNCRFNTSCCSVATDVHTLTRELQEVMVGLIAPACALLVPDIDEDLQIPMA